MAAAVMFNMSRRHFVVSTGLAAALGLNARLVGAGVCPETPDPPKKMSALR